MTKQKPSNLFYKSHVDAALMSNNFGLDYLTKSNRIKKQAWRKTYADELTDEGEGGSWTVTGFFIEEDNKDFFKPRAGDEAEVWFNMGQGQEDYSIVYLTEAIIKNISEGLSPHGAGARIEKIVRRKGVTFISPSIKK